MAVILDNLDYDEEKKKKKLEQELTGRKIPKVPKYLKLVTFGGPKKIPVPKLSSASGIEAPNLTEADVKHFYDTGDVAEFSTNPYPSENPPIVQDLASLRRSSELSGLTLLSSDSSSVSGVVWCGCFVDHVIIQCRVHREVSSLQPEVQQKTNDL